MAEKSQGLFLRTYPLETGLVGVTNAGNDYLMPSSLAEAALAASTGKSLIIAGGTDIYPAHVGRPLPSRIIDLSRIAELSNLTIAPDEIRLGATLTWTKLAQATLPPAFAALQEAARQVGSIQVQNRGTLGGNLCNTSPAADGIPPLMVLDAEIELTSTRGTRRLPIRDFVLGYRRNARTEDEILSAILVRALPQDCRSAFVKLGARKYLVISIVMAAALIGRDATGKINHARVAVGSAAETALRLEDLERDLIGLEAGVSPSSIIAPKHLEILRPIDDVRARADFRRDAAFHLVSEALDRAGGLVA